MAVDLVTE